MQRARTGQEAELLLRCGKSCSCVSPCATFARIARLSPPSTIAALLPARARRSSRSSAAQRCVSATAAFSSRRTPRPASSDPQGTLLSMLPSSPLASRSSRRLPLAPESSKARLCARLTWRPSEASSTRKRSRTGQGASPSLSPLPSPSPSASPDLELLVSAAQHQEKQKAVREPNGQ